MSLLTVDQQEACDAIASGHNVIIMGQAGTGKTFLVREAVSRLRNAGKTVAVTASTGMAARQYAQQGGTTIHHWAGMLDGRYDNQYLLRRLEAADDQSVIKRINETDVLLIDEISMISAKTFEQLEFICRRTRNSSTYFGNIQVICVGDFYQLKPVPDDLHNDPGIHVFNSQVWKSCLTHKIMLHEVMRQGDRMLITAVDELERGVPGPDTDALMYSLSRPLPHDARFEPIVLYGTNIDVDCHNALALRKTDGQMTIYRSEDSGDPREIKRVMAKHILSLKVGCPVMLIRNMSPTLVNGAIGTVLTTEQDGPTVRFGSTVIKLHKESFTVFDSKQHLVVADRKQYPITLAYAITIHKSQGLTIPRLIVNCDGIRQPGELGVAIGRSVNVDGLCVLGYDPSCSKRHVREVVDFCEEPGPPLNDDFSCCKTGFAEEGTTWSGVTAESYVGEWSEESDFDENDLKFIDGLDTEVDVAPVIIPKTAEFQLGATNDILNGLYTTEPVTDQQLHMNNAIDLLNESVTKVADFLNKHFVKISSIKKESALGGRGKIEQQGNFFKGYHTYLRSTEYQSACISLFRPRSVNSLLSGSLITEVRKYVLNEKQTAQQEAIVIQSIPVSGHGKVRYVGGRAIAKVKHHNTNLVRNDLESAGCVLDFSAKVKISLLNGMIKSQAEILEQSNHPESLIDVHRKQNLSCGLTNISDNVFEFFYT